ncbi:MAG: hypothetical protein D6812_17780 [Deltaproteobacteria bacterium]|nr:MAG: hypothetical protein D6812_17780 [Deltaproteobacteria bacterium]
MWRRANMVMGSAVETHLIPSVTGYAIASVTPAGFDLHKVLDYLSTFNDPLVFWVVGAVISVSLIVFLVIFFSHRSETTGKEEIHKSNAERMEKRGDFLQAGQLYLQIGATRKAIQMFRRAGAFTYLGDLYLEQGKWRKAISCYKQDENYEKLANVYEQRHDFQLAADAYERAGDFERAAELYARLDLLADAARCYLRKEDYEGLAKLYLDRGCIEEAAGIYARTFEFFYQRSREAGKAIPDKETLQILDKCIDLYRKTEQTDKIAHYTGLREQFEKRIEAKKKEEEARRRIKKRLLLTKGPKGSKEKRSTSSKNKSRTSHAVSSDEGIIVDTELASLIERGTPPESVAKAGVNATEPLPRSPEEKRAPEAKEKKKRKKKKPSATKVDESVTALLMKPSHSERYTLIRQIGRGGMGHVYLAKDNLLGRLMAYKVISMECEEDQKAIGYLMKEARSTAALNHPHIVTLYDVGKEGDNYFLAMEFVEGETLKALIKQSRLTIPQVLTIFMQLCDALRYAHENKILHLDVKPSNIMCRKGPQICTKLMDFGLARVMQARGSQTTARYTPFYVSPEQILNRNIDHRSDIYSLGVTLFEALVGSPPFQSGDCIYQHLFADPPSPMERNPQIPPQLDAIVRKSIAKKPKDRFQTMGEFLEAIMEVANLSQFQIPATMPQQLSVGS